MHKSCPNCHQDFMQEPGFYFGAMYFSYAFNIAVMVFFGLAYEILFNPVETWVTLLSVFLPAVILAPYNYRLSRALMLYIFGKKQKASADQHKWVSR